MDSAEVKNECSGEELRYKAWCFRLSWKHIGILAKQQITLGRSGDGTMLSRKPLPIAINPPLSSSPYATTLPGSSNKT